LLKFVDIIIILNYNIIMLKNYDYNQLGLEESEAKIYLALLESGPSTVSELTKKAKINRTLGYHVLQKLGWYGLAVEVKNLGNKKIYTALHPQRLVQHIKNKKNQWERNLAEVEKDLPELISLYSIADKPVIRFEEGSSGLTSIFEESLESKTEIFSILDVDSWQVSEFWDWAQSYNRSRNRKKIKEKILVLDTPASRKWVKGYKGSKVYTVYRWIKPEQVMNLLRFGGEINVYENKVMIALLQKPKIMGIMIESKILANILKAMFQMVWDQAKPVKFGKK